MLATTFKKRIPNTNEQEFIYAASKIKDARISTPQEVQLVPPWQDMAEEIVSCQKGLPLRLKDEAVAKV